MKICDYCDKFGKRNIAYLKYKGRDICNKCLESLVPKNNDYEEFKRKIDKLNQEKR